MSTNADSEQAVRHHYTLVCQCEWSEDEFTRTMASRNCVIHGDEPDPLNALLAEVEQLRAALDDLNALTFENDDDEKCVREVIARAGASVVEHGFMAASDLIGDPNFDPPGVRG